MDLTSVPSPPCLLAAVRVGSSRGIESDCWPCPVTSPCDWRPAHSVPRGTVRTGNDSTQRSHGYLTPDRIPCGGWGTPITPRKLVRNLCAFQAKEAGIGYWGVGTCEDCESAVEAGPGPPWTTLEVCTAVPLSNRCKLCCGARRAEHSSKRSAALRDRILSQSSIRTRRALAFGHCPKFALLALILCARPRPPAGWPETLLCSQPTASQK